LEKARPGLTRHERGIPLAILPAMVRATGLDIVHARRCVFSVTSKIQGILTRRGGVYNCRWVVLLDDLVSNLSIWSKNYHAENLYQKFRPLCMFVVASKPASSQSLHR
jgi:orotate phosphoribosyltransferase-like protein